MRLTLTVTVRSEGLRPAVVPADPAPVGWAPLNFTVTVCSPTLCSSPVISKSSASIPSTGSLEPSI